MVTEHSAARFRESGFLLLRGAFDPRPLSDEVDRSHEDGFWASAAVNVGSGGNEFRYVPMMCERTPASLSLLDELAQPATQLLGRPVLPVRAKGTRYFGGTAWHRDSVLDLPSIAFACYLEPLDAGNGALRVVPGSHRSGGSQLPEDMPITGVPIESQPGDVVAFDEHLLHGSVGGRSRRQWRVDYVADPVGADEELRVREYFAAVFRPGWDGGYDVDRYPSYGRHWQGTGRPETERLRKLGVYELAAAQEAAVLRETGRGEGDAVGLRLRLPRGGDTDGIQRERRCRS